MTGKADPPGKRGESSIRRKLAVLLALAILPVGLLGLVTAIYSYDRERQDLLKEIRLTADFVASERDNQIVEVRSVLVAIASTFDVTAAALPACGETLRRTLSTFPTYTNIAFLDRRGDLSCSALTPSSPINTADSAWFKSAMRGDKVAISKALFGRVSKKQIIFVAVPVGPDSANIGGVLGASIMVQELNKQPVALRYIENSHSAVLDMSGNIILSNQSAEDTGASWLPPPGHVRDRLAKNELVFIRASKSGAEYMYVMHPIALNQAVSLFAVRMDDKLQSIWLNFAGVAALPLLMWVAAVAAAWVGIDRLIVRPIIRLQRVTRAYASGHLAYRQPAKAREPKEIRDLGKGLNEMASAIQGRNEELKATLDRNRSLVREIHHRVKNNLQLIASIINARARATESEDEQELLSEIANRVRALAIVHAEFRGPEQAMAIDLRDVVRNIVAQHQASVGNGQHVSMALGETCRVNIDDAVPTALLVSEILSAGRELCDEDDTGEIRITLVATTPEAIDLTIAVDLPDAGLLADRNQSVSARLIDALGRQLKASIEVAGEDSFRLSARLEPAKDDEGEA